MAKTWYPVIDDSICSKCGACITKCTHGVYDAQKAPVPDVANGNACIDHCHGCGNLCPTGALRYFGEDTGWIPPRGQSLHQESACSCGGSKAVSKTLLIEYLYLDLQTCERCVGTEDVLQEVITVLTPALELAGYSVKYKKIEMSTREIAKKYRFLSSPTIRVNGHDICATMAENNCGCCGEISGTQVDCRVFKYNGETFEIPPKEMLAERILAAVSSKKRRVYLSGNYTFPENLKKFYDGKESKTGCGCGGENCCG